MNDFKIKKRVFLILLFTIVGSQLLFSQNPISVTEMSFQLNSNSTEEFYYSFAEGDLIVVDFELNKGKGVKFEVIELPYQTKTNQFTPRLTNYSISVSSTNVYLFRVTNGNGKKMCSLNIKRIPKSQETTNFNTGWQWKTLYDTTYTTYKEDSLVGHDTVHYTETVKEVASREISEEMLVNIPVEIRSIGWIDHDNPRAFVTVNLPNNQAGQNWEKKVIGWAFWLCVGDNSNSFWSRNKNAVVKGTTTIAGTTLSPLGALVVGGITNLVIPDASKVDNVEWAIVANVENKNAFMRGEQFYYIMHNNGPGAYGKFVNKEQTQGSYFICMYNDNIHDKIKVDVKASAVIETITYKDVEYQRTKIVPKYVKLTKTRTNVSSRQVRVPVN